MGIFRVDELGGRDKAYDEALKCKARRAVSLSTRGSHESMLPLPSSVTSPRCR